MNDLDLGNDDRDILPEFVAGSSGSFTCTTSSCVQSSSSGFLPVDVTQSLGSVTGADDIPGVTSNANQTAAQCDAGQTAISDNNDGLIFGDVSEHASISGCRVSGGESQLSDANVLGDFDNSTAPLLAKDVLVHRSQVLKDLIEEFKALDIPTHMYHLNLVIINERGEIEEGRGLGVVQEVITIFWNQFFMSLSTSATEKVPSVRHDYQHQEWEAISKILVYGYCEIMYFPVTLSGVFMGSCLFEERDISDSFLLEAFSLYISKDEAETLKQCKEGKLEPNDDDVLEVLSSYKCYKKPTKENIELIITQLAHQELVQKPRYISNCWKPVISSLKSFSQFRSLDSMAEMYEAKNPTGKKVIKLLAENPQNEDRKSVV